MMHFIYEEAGISVSMETDATSLYEGYDSGAGVLGHFQRFLAAAGYAIGVEDELTIFHDGEVTVDKENYLAEMEELDELREMAKAAKYAPDEITNCDDKTDDGWIEWRGGEQPVPDGTPVEFRLRDGVGHTTRRSENLIWDHSDDACSVSDIVAYRVVE